MFLFISLVFAKNYCIERTSGDCIRKCSNFKHSYDDIFARFPDDSELKNDEIHNIYISDNFEYKKTKNNLIFCDPSNYLIYTNFSSSIKIKNVIETDYENISTNIPILFQTFGNVNLEVDANETSKFSPIILKAINMSTNMSIKFISETIPQNLLSISKNSEKFRISNLTDKVRKIFNTTEKILETKKRYYCISDKQEKCRDYTAFELTFINSIREVNESNCVIIIDTTIPQFYDPYYSNFNTHIICLPGSDVTVNMYDAGSSQVLTLTKNSIEIQNIFIEGGGSITIMPRDDFILNCATTTNNLNFTLKSRFPLNYDYSKISAPSNGKTVTLSNKIKVSEFSVFHGDRSLLGLFEEGKFICDDEITRYDISSSNLKEYVFNNMNYHFKEGNHEIPVAWKKRSTFYGTPKTTFTFNDVHSYFYDCIDGFIRLSDYKSVTIKPSKQLYIQSFSDEPKHDFTIHVDHDFIMEGKKYDDPYHDRDEVEDRWCSITGRGTIKFISEDFMEDVKYFCRFNENDIKFEYLGQSSQSRYYVCVGQSDLEDCKSEIKDIDSLSNAEFIWVRNIDTINRIYNCKTAYITDYQYTTYYYISNNVILTANANLVIENPFSITIKRNGINNYIAQDKKAKLTILLEKGYSSRYRKLGFYMNYYEDPTEIDFRVYFYYEHIQLFTYYRDEYNKSAIPIEGRCCIYIREPFVPMINFFKYPSSIVFVINYDNDFHQICYANEAKECTELDDFVLAKNIDEFTEYDRISSGATVHIFKNIFLHKDTNSYKSTQFKCRSESITIGIKVPNDALINFESSSIYVISAKKYNFYSYNYYKTNYVFDLKEKVTLDCSSSYYYYYYSCDKYNFTSSEESVYIMANYEVKNMKHISVSGDFYITSPVPQYLRPLFDENVVINQSSNWTYLHYSEEGLKLFESFPSTSYKDYLRNDDDLSRNIVLAVGPNDNISFPRRWRKEHNVIILQNNRNFLIDEPTNLTFCYDGMKINNLIKIVCSKSDIILPKEFTINAYFPYHYYYYYYMNDVELICSSKTDTYLYTGNFDIHWSYSQRMAKISGYKEENMLIIKYDSSVSLYNLKRLLSYSSSYCEHSFLYDYICHSPSTSICNEYFNNYFLSNDAASFLKAVGMNPNTKAFICQDLRIPYTTGHYYRLNLLNKNIKVSLPPSPCKISINENNSIIFEYLDFTVFEFMNQGTIDVDLSENLLDLDIKSNTNSTITFNLQSDIHMHAISDYKASFKISVIKNNHHLYTDDFDQLEPIFGDSIEYFIQYCAHDSTNYSIEHCTYLLNDTIENVFKEPLITKQIEIAPLTIPTNIDLFKINFSIEVNVMSDSLAFLNLSNVSSIQINKDQSVLNEYWKFKGDFTKMIIKMNQFSSISIGEEIEQPMTFELTNRYSVIDLKYCVQQNKSFITFINEGVLNNEVTLYGNNESQCNFIHSIKSHEDITFKCNGSDNYVCTCTSEEVNKKYYCISDKEEKCKNYSSFELIFKNSTEDIVDSNCVIIIDTTIPQFYDPYYSNFNTHIICLPGSDVTVNMYDAGSSQVLTLTKNSIEIQNIFIEGGGSITIIPRDDFILNCSTTTNNLNFTLKSRFPLNYDYSKISAPSNGKTATLSNKIKVAEFSVFHGDRSLLGLFEEGKFICDDEITRYDISSSNLKEYVFNNMNYHFKEGNHEIPVAWKKRSYLYGTPKTTFTFNDVHSFYDCIDGFIRLSDYKSVTIKPSKQLYIQSFSDEPKHDFTIHVDHDFIMEGNKYDDPYHDRDEVEDRWCSITGRGTIKFISEDFMEDVKYFCRFNENEIKFEYLSQSSQPRYYVCVGQSDLSGCKSEIKNVESLSDSEFLWIRNIDTIKHIYNCKTAYITDYQYTTYYYSDVVLTANANLVIDSSNPITIKRNRINDFIAQDKKAKLTVLLEKGYSSRYRKLGFYMHYYEDPTEIDFRVYFYYEHIQLFTYYRDEYNKSAIPIEGRCCIYIREPFVPMINFFKYPSSIVFVINYDNDFHQICYANEAKECTELDDFVLAKNIDEFTEYDRISSGATVHIFKNIFLHKDTNSYKSTQFKCRSESITIGIKVPNDALINFESSSIYVISAKKYNFYSYNYYKTNYVFDLKEKVTLDCSSSYYYYYYSCDKYNFTSSEESVYIMANSEVKNMKHISVSGDFYITSPVPQYLRPLFDENVVINQSSNWTYLHYSEEGLKLFESFPSTSYKDYLRNDDDLSRNIVLAVGPNDNISFPRRWRKEHNVFILQNSRNFLIDEPTNLTFCYDGLLLNNKIRIVQGRVDIILPKSLSINAFFPYRHYYCKNMNNVRLICLNQFDTYLYTGYFDMPSKFRSKQATIYGYGSFDASSMLIIKCPFSRATDVNALNALISYSSSNYKCKFTYDYICYARNNANCHGDNFFLASNISSFMEATKEDPFLPILVRQDLRIPYRTGNYYRLNISNERIKVGLPPSPYKLFVNSDDSIIFEYPDLTTFEFMNKSTIDVELDEYPLDLDIKSNTNSLITFNLQSNIHMHAISDYKASFKISVIKNNHHLYTDDFEQLEPIFGDSIEYFIQYCAHDSTNYSIEHCTYLLNDTIENVFKEPLITKQIEIAPLTIPTNINLFKINFSIEVNVMSDSLEFLNLSNVSSIQINKDQSVLNEYWKFKGDFTKMIIKMNQFSSISIGEEIEQPMTFELTSRYSVIDLKYCVQQNKPFITFINEGILNNEVTLYGNKKTYDNFIGSIKSHEGITFIRNGSKKYLCVCMSEESCNKCKANIEGRIIDTDSIESDPGEEVEIRIFSNFEISSEIFTNSHNVLIDPTIKLNLTNVEGINQNITEGLIADNLIFKDVSNLLIKPKGPSLDITVKKYKAGLIFKIELDTFLKFNVVNSNEEGIVPSRIIVSGSGELNVHDYPSHRIRPESTAIKVIKGVYIICDTNEGNDVCSYNTEKDYKALGISDSFRSDFDFDWKIIVLLDSFTRDVVAPISYLRGQKVQIIRTNSRLLEEKNNCLRIVESERLTIGETESELRGSVGGAFFDISDFDSIVIDVNDTFYIKQEGNISSNESSREVRLEATSESVTMFVDDSVDIKNQRVKIESSQNKTISIRVVANVTDEKKDLIKNFVKASPGNVIVNIE
ncbi:hypothetical protein M9Y10_038597 [Tritrichomonas musculus]|uniref:Uncharacterized protein n=1 Tax=Tritrichomonas musculus TaxID=1915356 RepID=A0ABR2K9K7_9EUKA